MTKQKKKVTKKRVIKTQFSTDYNYESTGKNKDMGKSMTLPDQNLTIKELLDRHSRGVNLTNCVVFILKLSPGTASITEIGVIFPILIENFLL